ncbi:MULTISPECIES: GNAT family N-acetyltransferase [unclassified Shewanella]|uniref:GNAT family N-acetyltransferase n=1 Tax=unclassified Shewanella TaxID=196818 RepID=UPI001BC60E5A|nr:MULTISPECIES: GNAT family N-acetyltransferase [unclassified Shewanella]GIU09674.1 GCN5 family N-acetyltransferase [Shewanella sp. MBTL60-112-B1]GIU34173.1 GCN5 family N-acetyltransferase [Shewanella sp. MBTL60-112-B2]
MKPPVISVRPFAVKDVTELAQVFHLSINQGAASHYSEMQRKVWSPNLRSDEVWLERLSGTLTWVAETSCGIIGFINLKKPSDVDCDSDIAQAIAGSLAEAEVDCLFTHPEFVGMGVAKALYAELENKALTLGIKLLTVQASYLAKPVFERFGFETITQNSHNKGDQVLVNFSMIKQLYQLH